MPVHRLRAGLGREFFTRVVFSMDRQRHIQRYT
jgi:hypothetical protein